jgi:glycerol kinase
MLPHNWWRRVPVSRTKLILSVDQGTTNTKAILIDRAGNTCARASHALSIAFPQPGWVEQDAREIWASVRSAAGDCMAQAGDAEIAAVGISNQRESALLWDRVTGEPAGPCITWQCRRTSGFCGELRRNGLEAVIRDCSGLPVDPLFSASKIRWLLSSIPDGFARAASGELYAGTVDSWLLWNLTSRAAHRTDASNASRTQLLNLKTCSWDARLLEIFGIPEACLPEVRTSSGIAGITAGCGLVPAGVPVASLIGDSHAALVGHAAFAPGAVKATYGTGSSLMSPLDHLLLSRHGLSATVAWSQPGHVRYALEGNITNTGGTVQWLAGMLRAAGAEEVAALAETVSDSGGAYLVPAFAGLGAPHWDAAARGVIAGLTRGTTAAHLARAAIESIAYQVHDVFEAMRQDTAMPLPALYADGGASRNRDLMQFQSDILGCPVIRGDSADLSAIGAAWLAGLAIGFWESLDELAALPRPYTRFEPCMNPSRREALLAGWHEAVGRTRSTVKN